MQSLQEENDCEELPRNCSSQNKFDQVLKLKDNYTVKELRKAICNTNLTLLKKAMDSRNVKMISLLLKYGMIDLKQKEYSDVLVHLLEDQRNLSSHIFHIACLLLNAGASTKRPVLHFAVENNHVLVVEELLIRDVNPNEKRDKTQDKTPLMIAGKKGYSEIIKILCTYGARDNILDKQGNNALTITIHSLDFDSDPISLEDKPGHQKSIELLCEYGSDLDIRPRSNNNMTPIESAKKYSHQTVVKLLESIARNRKDKQEDKFSKRRRMVLGQSAI